MNCWEKFTMIILGTAFVFLLFFASYFTFMPKHVHSYYLGAEYGNQYHHLTIAVDIENSGNDKIVLHGVSIAEAIDMVERLNKTIPKK